MTTIESFFGQILVFFLMSEFLDLALLGQKYEFKERYLMILHQNYILGIVMRTLKQH